MKQIAVITGASSGMGREFVKQLISQEKRFDEIWIIARRQSVLEELAEQFPKQKFQILPLDLEESESWKIYQKKLEEECPAIRVLVNAAGYGVIGKTKEIDMMEQTGMIRLNCEALEAITQISIPYFRRGSRVIMVASGSAFFPQPGFNVYAATKAFVLNYSRALGRELRKDGVFITTVCPGPVETEFFERAEAIQASPSYKKRFRASKERVVAQAIRDSKRRKSISVYGISMKALRIAAKVVPHELLLKGFR
jgi:hypothetical protein